MSDISYEGVDEAELVLALHQNTRPLGFGHLHDKNLSLEEVKAHLDEYRSKGLVQTFGGYSFDYFYGRPLKVTLDVNAKMLRCADLYDRDAGPGLAEHVIKTLRKAKAE